MSVKNGADNREGMFQMAISYIVLISTLLNMNTCTSSVLYIFI